MLPRFQVVHSNESNGSRSIANPYERAAYIITRQPGLDHGAVRPRSRLASPDKRNILMFKQMRVKIDGRSHAFSREKVNTHRATLSPHSSQLRSPPLLRSGERQPRFTNEQIISPWWQGKRYRLQNGTNSHFVRLGPPPS